MITADILTWVATLPKWEQELANHIIQNHKITENVLNEVYDIFKIETKLETGEVSDNVENLYSINLQSKPRILWKGVSNLRGVNKLKSDTNLEISDGLTVVYGENGSGKSGYTRLLNNAFISRGDQEILPNIYSPTNEPVSADFLFDIDGSITELQYPNSKNEFAFKTVRIFDSKSASSDLNEESKVDFAPSELKFFDSLLSACVNLQEKIDSERKKRMIDNPTLKFFPNEGTALSTMQSLSAHTDVDEIQRKFIVTDEDKQKYEKIKKEKANLIALDINKQVKLIEELINYLKEANKRYDSFANAVSNENIEIYKQQIIFLKKAQIIHDTDGLALFEGENVELLGSEDWKVFIQSAKKYYDRINAKETCPLCGNEIDEQDLIFKYWKYLESDAESNLNLAKKALEMSKNSLSEMDLTFLLKSSVQEQWLRENYQKETDEIESIFKKAETEKNQILQNIDQRINDISTVSIIKPDISSLIKKISEYSVNLNQESVNARIKECEKFENEYIDKEKVNDLIPVIKSYIEILKWDDLANKNRIKTRNITNKQKELFEKYVTTDYINTFKDECKKLEADFNLDIVSRGSSGQTLKKLQIRDAVPGKILSEGEQRAVAVANFLTEVHMDTNNVAIVFDDPVSSLDHKRRSLIANRLSEESKKRQVVVFTHEITFFIELKSIAEKNNLVFQQETIRSLGDIPGDISESIPWVGMKVSERIKKLKSDYLEIKKYHESNELEEYYYKAKAWCELLRESWERAIEEILFNDAIQRYNPAVQTKRLERAPFTQQLYAELEQGMSDCSAWCHDQSRAINSNIPNPNDLEKYIHDFESFCKNHRP